MTKKIIAIIPARGGSAEIPRKNIRMFGGKPLIGHTILHALGSVHVERVIVSTDSPEIAETSKSFKAEVIYRPKKLSLDTSISEDALLHVLSELEEKENYFADIVVFLQATSPLRRPEDIDNAIRCMMDEDADSLFSAKRSHDFLWHDADGCLKPLNYDFNKRPRRQVMNREYFENGSIYITKTSFLKKSSNRLGGKIAVYEMGRWESHQIDTEDDFTFLEQYLLFSRNNLCTKKLEKTKLFVLDFDGIFTDNKVLVLQDGTEGVICSRSDGMGLELLKKTGIKIAVISSETNPVVSARANKLGIECIQGEKDKISAFKSLIQRSGVSRDETSYMGNDLNDLECMRYAGISITVADAHPEILKIADIITSVPGGAGAIREITDRLMSIKEVIIK